ncbi:MAG: 6-phosphofructokinase, partial [Paratractidigestivibacter faecalis]
VEIMGRDAGWLAGAAALAGEPGAGRPDLVLLPEVPLDEDALLARISDLLASKNTVMVGVSEGVRTADGRLIAAQTVAAGTGTDEFGHLAQLSGTSRYLAGVTKARLGVKTRAVELSTLQRCASHVASKTDLDEARELGRLGVRAALDGQSVKMCALERVSDAPYETCPALLDVLEVANKVKPVPRAWISADGMDVTANFERYARPLIAGEEPMTYVDGIPARLAPLA